MLVIYQLRKLENISINIVLILPSTFDSARSAAWFGFSIISRSDLRSAYITQHAEQVQYVEPQEITFS